MHTQLLVIYGIILTMGLESVQKKLSFFGLHPYDKAQLVLKKKLLQDQIVTGLKRTVATQRLHDGGLAAIPTLTHPVTQEEWSKVKEGEQVISCAFAGTNWVAGSVTKRRGEAVFEEQIKKSIPVSDRVLTYGQFIGRMADHIEATHTRLSKDVYTVAISLGFQHENILATTDSIDAKLLGEEPGKFWKITDFSEHKDDLLGESLLKELHSRGLLHINRIVFQNDTNAVSHHTTKSDRKKLPLGFVFGTGDNASLEDRNLEAGYGLVDGEDMVFNEMKRRNLIPHGEQRNIMEYRMGGDFIKYRAIAGLGLLQKHGEINFFISQYIIRALLQNNDGAMISKIASGTISRTDLNKVLNTHGLISKHMYEVLRLVAQTALTQAGQLIGVMISAVAETSGYTGGSASVNVEGAVYWNGHMVKDTADKTIKQLIPESDLHATQAMGLIGVAQLGMVRSLSQ